MYKDRAERTAAKKAAADSLKTTVKRVNRMKICDLPLESVEKRREKAENAQKHREKCNNLALLVLAGHATVKEAAEKCELTVRQMYRWIQKYKDPK